MMSYKYLVAGVVLAVSGCVGANDASTRSYAIDPAVALTSEMVSDMTYEQYQAYISTIKDTSVPEGAGMTKEEFAKELFPGSTKTSDQSAAIALFQKTCVTHTPNIPAIVAAGEAAGMEMEIDGNSAFGSKFSGGAMSLQINMASSYAYECAVTAVGDQKSDAKVRQAFFAAMGTSHRGGEGTISLGGKSYILKHIVLGGGAFGINEHAFLIQGN